MNIQRSAPRFSKGRAPKLHTWDEIRRINFAVLDAVASLIPSGSDDVRGCAKGILPIVDIAARAGVSVVQVRKTIAFFRTWRVLWTRLHAPDAIEVRFERRVAVGLLTAQRLIPRQVKKLMAGHRARRECVVLLAQASPNSRCASVHPALG